MTPLLTGLLLASSPASAQAAGGASVLLGTSTAFDGDPASLRLSVRGEGDLTDGEILGLSALMPVTIASRGEGSFGLSASQTIIELPPSLRLRLFPEGPVRGYGDLGAGVVVGTSAFDGWFFDDSNSNLAFMTRFALGLEVGSADGLAVIVEPISVGTYHASKQTNGTFGLMLGIGARI